MTTTPRGEGGDAAPLGRPASPASGQHTGRRRRRRWVARRPRWLRELTLLAILLTMVDGAASYVWFTHGVAVEGNPVVNGLIGWIGLSPALLVRVLVGALFVLLLYRLRGRSRLARHALEAAPILLAGVALWHLVGLASILAA